MGQFIDTHCHFDGISDFESIFLRSQQASVSPIILSGCNRQGIVDALSIAERYDSIFVTVGYHPDTVHEVHDEDLAFLETILSHPKVVGIGEIGLDYHYGKDDYMRQIALFQKQLNLAQQYHLPVVIHTRDAMQETYNILSSYSLHGVIHCFSGSVEMAYKFLKLGYFLGIGGVVTFRNSKLYQVVEKVSLDSILLETDSPYLSPEPYRGMENGSWNIPIIAGRIAEIKGVSLEQVGLITTANAKRLFDLTEKL